MMQIEQSTIYAYKLKYLENPNFDKIRSFAQSFINELPLELRDELFEKLNRGVDLLQSEPVMLIYLFSFGNMHQAKLNYAFEHLPDSFFEQREINIIDYGCGQAIGTMCYIDYLKTKNPSQKIKSVTLIEPSEICLKRAGLHTSAFLPDAEIRLINKTFDQLSDDDIVCDEKTPTLHILSNVLDLDFDLKRFASLIEKNIKGFNQFVCVDPVFFNAIKDQRLQLFAKYLKGNITFSKILGKGELNPEKTWTCQAIVFSMGEIEDGLSTEVTEDDLKNAWIDEYDVKYSADGKKLLGVRTGWVYVGVPIKAGTRVICDGAFELDPYGGEGYSDFQSIIIPDGVIKIGKSAFRDCERLISIILPSSMKWISENAFDRCDNLTYIYIPVGTKKKFEKMIPRYKHLLVERQETSLTEVTEEDLANAWIDEYGVKYSADKKKLLSFSRNIDVKEYLIKEDTIVICNQAFFYCENLKSVVIPNHVTHIGFQAFARCGIQSVVIPSSMQEIGEYAFDACHSLITITIQEGIKKIENEPFGDCYYIQSVSLPNSVTSIGEKTFEDCESLLFITIPQGTIEKFKKLFAKKYHSFLTTKALKNVWYDDCGAEYSLDKKILYRGPNRYYKRFFHQKDLPPYLQPAFYVWYEIRKGTEVVSDDAFRDFESDELISGCESLEFVSIPNSVKEIGEFTFKGCKSLKSVTISNSVENIGEYAFSGCESLKFVSIPNSVENIEECAFKGCKSLSHVSIPSSVKFIGFGAFSECESLQGISIPEGVETIGTAAFAMCSTLKSIDLPNSVINIYHNVFLKCESLQEIVIPKGSMKKFKKMLDKDLWDKLIERN